MASTYETTEGGTSIREVFRALRNATISRDQDTLSIVTSSGPALELAPADATPPRIEPAPSIEGDSHAARPVGEPVVAFAAFLDGIQSSKTILLGRNAAPVVHGTVAAVVRRRTDRALHVWRGGPRVSRALYVPVALIGAPELERLQSTQAEIVDTLVKTDPQDEHHPMALLALARDAVQRRRESLEIALAEEWCDTEHEPLFVDGGISGTGRASQSTLAVGVVKSHRTLYTAAGALGVVTGLAAGSRTPAFEIRSAYRTAVASWYLRLRDASGRDPFFGLVRVEVARESWSADRADLVSRWILAERAPVSLPDKRWSTMAYGIRDCEEYLRALVT